MFVIGIKIGVKVRKEEEIKLPSIESIPKKIHQYKENKEQAKELKEFQRDVREIENY